MSTTSVKEIGAAAAQMRGSFTCLPPGHTNFVLAEPSAASPWEAAHESQALLTMTYTPLDLAGHYDRAGLLHVCAKCGGEQAVSTNYYPHNAHRRQQCVAAPNIPGMTQPSVARFATEGLVSYAITPGEPHYVQKSAPTDSRHARKVIANGYADFTPPNDRGEALASTLGSSGFWSEDPAQ
jgi:hypothetical protein